MYNLLFKSLSRSNKLSILIYHQVLAEYDPMRPYELYAGKFTEHLQWLAKSFTLLTLQDAVEKLHNDCLPANAAVITFDDGYENNASVALPLLQKFDSPATFFIASDFLNSGAMWNDKIIEFVRHWPEASFAVDEFNDMLFDTSTIEKRYTSAEALLLKLKYLPFEQRQRIVERLDGYKPAQGVMMSDEQVRQLDRAGMEIGGHTCSHPILAKLDEPSARQQIVDNKNRLEEIIGHQIYSFAYPNGKPGKDYNDQSVDLVKDAGYRCAVSTHKGVSTKHTDVFQLNRFTPWKTDKLGFLGLLAKNYF